MRVAFYDRSDTGHHAEFVRHLLRYRHDYPDIELILVVTDKMLDMVKDDLGADVVTLTTKDFSDELKDLAAVCVRERVDHIFFMNIDPYLLRLGDASLATFDLSGIFFHPYHRIRRSSFKSVLKYAKRSYTVKKALRNRRLKRMYLLDDQLEDHVLDPRICYLPDPIEQSGIRRKANENLDDNTVKILAFGSVIPRKNLEVLIDAVCDLSDERYLLQIVGRGKDEYVEQLKERVNAQKTNSRIVFVNRFVSDAEKEDYFSSSDIISLVYKDFYGSSGALGHAVAYGKKVLVSDKGLINHLVQKHELGKTVNEQKRNVQLAIVELASSTTFNRNGYEAYILEKTPKQFAQVIFGNLLNDNG